MRQAATAAAAQITHSPSIAHAPHLIGTLSVTRMCQWCGLGERGENTRRRLLITEHGLTHKHPTSITNKAERWSRLSSDTVRLCSLSDRTQSTLVAGRQNTHTHTKPIICIGLRTNTNTESCAIAIVSTELSNVLGRVSYRLSLSVASGYRPEITYTPHSHDE